MAQAAAQAARKLKDVAETAEDALERDEADRLRNQIADLQADVSRLLHSLAEMGKARGEAVAETLTGAVRAGPIPWPLARMPPPRRPRHNWPRPASMFRRIR